MTAPAFDHDLVIVGLGAAGMAAAEFAVSLGLKVVAVERDRVGGDALWNATMPTKALLAAANAANTMRTASRFGLPDLPADTVFDLAAVWRSIATVQRSIADGDDSAERFTAMGVEIVNGSGRVTGPNEVTVDVLDDGRRVITAAFVLVCPGSRPAVPSIAGLDECGFLTSETLFALDRPPASLVIVGAGPVGVELSQALNRLGVRVTLLTDSPTILPRDEPTLVTMLQHRLVEEGVEFVGSVDVARVERDGDEVIVHGADRTWRADEVLIATGRVVNAEGLGLEDLGIAVGTGGVDADSRGRTSVKSIYVAGDITGRHQFGHAAASEAVRSLRDAFFPGRSTPIGDVAWCTFTDPPCAHAGLTIAEAEQRFGDDVEVWRIDLAHNDRARVERSGDGAVVVVTAKGRVIGAHVLAPNAGEVVHELALAVEKDMKLADLADLVHIHPTIATSIGQLATEAASERAQKLRWLVRHK
ncbi:MAG: NAD(P)/FAD-dependent oxidoreductase [Acidimicrobiia bacterium]